jgi:phage terminase Nu1 subunit (DNA packaging protein)
MARSAPAKGRKKPGRKSGPDEQGRVRSSVLARLLGITMQHVTLLAREGMPRDGEWFDPAVCVQWYIRYRASSVANDPDENNTFAKEHISRARKLAAEASIAELNLEERRGKLIPLGIHEERVEDFASRVFAALTGQLAPQLRIEFPELETLALQGIAERLGDVLIAACRSTALDDDDQEDDGSAAAA